MSGLRSQGSHRRRGVSAPVALAALLLLVSPTHAYRVFFDYDQDANRGTFQNEVIGPDTVPVKIVVELDKDDGTPPWIHFSIHSLPFPYGQFLHGISRPTHGLSVLSSPSQEGIRHQTVRRSLQQFRLPHCL